MHKHMALIGLSGTGKSTVARVLAERFGWDWEDTDAIIVAQTGCTIAEIFASEGETAFRNRETAVLRTILHAATRPCVIATGGGIVLQAANRDLLRTYAYVVWMDAPTSTLLARLQAHAEQRPLLTADDSRARLDALRAARCHLYRSLADQVIDTSNLTPEQVAAAVLNGYQGSAS